MEYTEFDDDDVPETENANLDHDAIQKAVLQILNAVGEDSQREGLQYTPRRVARMYDEMLSGYRTDPQKFVNGALFEIKYDEMVLVRDIEFPEGVLVGAVMRGETVLKPTGSLRISEGDVVALFAMAKDVPEVERLLQVSIDFF